MVEIRLLAMQQPVWRWHEFSTGLFTERGNLSY